MRIKAIVLVCLFVLLVVFSGCVNEGTKLKPALCEEVVLQENKDVCYHGIAVETNDEMLCGKIMDLNRRDECYTDLALGSRYRWFD